VDLQTIAQILEPFHRLSRELEGNRSSGYLYDVFPAMDQLLSHLEEAKKMHGGTSKYILDSIELAWSKLDKYYTLADNNEVLFAAVALDPSQKMDYFESQWESHPTWIEKARTATRNLWNLKYRNISIISNNLQENNQNQQLVQQVPFRTKWKRK